MFLKSNGNNGMIGAFPKTPDEHQESIEQLKKDQEIAGLYIKDLDARLDRKSVV